MTTRPVHSTTEISNDWDLWNEYVNPSGEMEREEFEAMSTQEKNKFQKECFPDECDDVDDDGNEIDSDD